MTTEFSLPNKRNVWVVYRNSANGYIRGKGVMYPTLLTFSTIVLVHVIRCKLFYRFFRNSEKSSYRVTSTRTNNGRFLTPLPSQHRNENLGCRMFKHLYFNYTEQSTLQWRVFTCFPVNASRNWRLQQRP